MRSDAYDIADPDSELALDPDEFVMQTEDEVAPTSIRNWPVHP
jgi:hypothetical protein